MRLIWVLRERGETLWDHLRDRPAPKGDSRFVWITAERTLVRKAKARFRGALGLRPDEGYFAYYWTDAATAATHSPSGANGDHRGRHGAAPDEERPPDRLEREV